jgi:hypothetical protein
MGAAGLTRSCSSAKIDQRSTAFFTIVDLSGIMQMKILRNIFAVIIGLLAGGILNMALVTVSPLVIPPPEGVDVTKAESLAASIHLFEPKHFVFPFLAHALGTLAGALVAYLIAGSYRSVFAFTIGAFFLVGGIMVAFTIPAPLWFIFLDLAAAYLPMAWIGTLIGRRLVGGGGQSGRVA